MTTYQQLAATLARRIKSDGPNPYETAQLFAPHDKCETVTSMDDEDTGVIERNDGKLMTITFDIEGYSRVTGWQYATYQDSGYLEDSDAYHTGGSTGSLEDTAWDITETVIDWLDESFQSARSTDSLALHALAYTLEDDDFNTVSVEDNAVVVAHYNDWDTKITLEYSHDGYRRYLTGYSCTLHTPQGDAGSDHYSDLDELRAALKKQEAIDPDAIKQAFIAEVDAHFSDDIWEKGHTLDEVIECWEPNDFGDAAYKDQVNVVGVVDVHLNVHGEVESADLVALGDFWGEEAETLSGGDLFGNELSERVARWFRDVIADHIEEDE